MESPLILFFFLASMAQAAPEAQEKTKNTTDSHLDFEGDVIENDSRLPSLLTGFDAQAATLELLIFKRSDFNDTHGSKIETPFHFQPNQSQVK